MPKNIIRPINNNTNKLNMKTIFIINSNSNVHFSVPFHFENCASVRVAWPYSFVTSAQFLVLIIISFHTLLI